MKERIALGAAMWMLSLLFLLAVQPALADTPKRKPDLLDLDLRLNASTLGWGGEVGVRFVDRVGIRAGIGTLTVNHEGTYDDVDYNAKIDFDSWSLMADIFPFGTWSRGGGFRLTGGVRHNQNAVILTSIFEATDTVTIGDQTFTGSEVVDLRGTIDFPKEYAPYAGLGFDFMFHENVGMVLEFGAMFQGRPDVSLTSESTNATVQAELAEEEANIQEDLDFFRYYPVLNIGLIFRF